MTFTPALTGLGALIGDTIPRGVVLGAGALAGGYVIGCIPVAWLVLRRLRRRPRAIRGNLMVPTQNTSATLSVLSEGGVRAAAAVIVLELLKGAVAGLGARFYDETTWFCVMAIAGVVVGDTFPVGLRQPRRGIVPLVSGMFFALPGTLAAGVVVAVAVLLVRSLSEIAWEAIVVCAIPGALLLATREPSTLVPGLIIVVAIVGRNRLRRAARLHAADAWRRRRAAGIPAFPLAPPGGRPEPSTGTRPPVDERRLPPG